MRNLKSFGREMRNLEGFSRVPFFLECSTTITRKYEYEIKKKRKRITTSVSKRSIQELVPKKKKKDEEKQIIMYCPSNNLVSRPVANDKPQYIKMPKYLKIFQNLLFQTLRIQLKHTLKKKKEQKIHT